MSSLTTVDEVRRISGVTSINLAPDADVTASITEAESEVEKYLNTTFTPRERIDIIDGDDTIRVIVDKNPLMALRALKINGTSITIDGNLFISKESGKIELNSDGSPEETRFKKKKKTTIIKYIYGSMEESPILTSTTVAATAGSAVALTVSDEIGFSVNDWIEIYGMDGNRESAKVTVVATTTITVDVLSFAHESESTVVKLQVNDTIKKLMRIIAGIALVARVVGESFDDITGYTVGEFQVQKGEPFTQWRETALQLQKEAREILARIKPRPAIF